MYLALSDLNIVCKYLIVNVQWLMSKYHQNFCGLFYRITQILCFTRYVNLWGFVMNDIWCYYEVHCWCNCSFLDYCIINFYALFSQAKHFTTINTKRKVIMDDILADLFPHTTSARSSTFTDQWSLYWFQLRQSLDRNIRPRPNVASEGSAVKSTRKI